VRWHRKVTRPPDCSQMGIFDIGTVIAQLVYGSNLRGTGICQTGMPTGPIRRTKPNKFKQGPVRTAVFVVVSLGVLVSLPLLFWLCYPAQTHEAPAPRYSSAPTSWPPDLDETDFSNIPVFEPGGPVYPYSVVPGGVSSAKQLQTVLDRDPVVAAHYSGFRMRYVHLIRLAADRKAYVSYRVGNRVYWTRKQLTLRAGETLLTDGTHLARTRCGNRISEVPADPSSTSEPPAEVLNTADGPKSQEFTTDSPPPAPIWADNPPPILLASGNPPPGGNGPFLPPPPIVSCCGSSPGSSPSPNPPSNPPPSGPSPFPEPPSVPPIATPEPASLPLLAIGLAGLLLVWKFRGP